MADCEKGTVLPAPPIPVRIVLRGADVGAGLEETVLLVGEGYGAGWGRWREEAVARALGRWRLFGAMFPAPPIPVWVYGEGVGTGSTRWKNMSSVS